MSDVKQKPNDLLATATGEVLRSEWVYWAGGALFAFAVAYLLMSGGGLPILSTPFSYAGDGLFHSWMAQRVIEGWLFDNPRSGYPFGSLFLDYPGSDAASHFLLKILGMAGGGFPAAMNLYFLLGFAVAFAVSYLVLRKLGLSIALALVGAFAFDFLPFHFLRLRHLFYTWYFVVPVFFYLGFRCFDATESTPRPSTRKIVLLIIGLIAVASFGVYNALFGVIVLAVAGAAGAIARRSLRPLWWASACGAIVAVGVLLNVLPNIAHRSVDGANPEVAQRSPAEAEIYGLKLTQLIIPRLAHRNEHLAEITGRYNRGTPLSNENVTATLGMIGAIGLLVLFAALVVRVAGGRVDDRISLLALVVLVLFLFGTVGGLGSLFANIVSPAIRGWNRISVFIAFGAIAGFLILLQSLLQRYLTPQRSRMVFAAVAMLLAVLVYYDQTTPACPSCNAQTQRDFENDRAFVQAIEGQLAAGAAVYQLPYMPFPEAPSQHQLPEYGLTAGFVHSKALRWSHGGMKGRPGDLFFRGLAQEPIERQIEVIRRLGFSGIYIDRRGYADKGEEIVAQLTAALGYGPSLEHAAHKLVFFPLNESAKVQLEGLSADEIMRKAGYRADRLGQRHQASLAEGIDFTRSTWPEFIRDARGISAPEPWGRWSDANIDRVVRFDFLSALPAKFTLVLSARPFGRDGEQAVAVRIGGQTHRVVLRGETSETRLPIVLGDSSADAIEFIPENPVSPQQLGVNGDPRKLGIGFVRLRLEP